MGLPAFNTGTTQADFHVGGTSPVVQISLYQVRRLGRQIFGRFLSDWLLQLSGSGRTAVWSSNVVLGLRRAVHSA